MNFESSASTKRDTHQPFSEAIKFLQVRSEAAVTPAPTLAKPTTHLGAIFERPQRRREVLKPESPGVGDTVQVMRRSGGVFEAVVKSVGTGGALAIEWEGADGTEEAAVRESDVVVVKKSAPTPNAAFLTSAVIETPLPSVAKSVVETPATTEREVVAPEEMLSPAVATTMSAETVSTPEVSDTEVDGEEIVDMTDKESRDRYYAELAEQVAQVQDIAKTYFIKKDVYTGPGEWPDSHRDGLRAANLVRLFFEGQFKKQLSYLETSLKRNEENPLSQIDVSSYVYNLDTAYRLVQDQIERVNENVQKVIAASDAVVEESAPAPERAPETLAHQIITEHLARIDAVSREVNARLAAISPAAVSAEKRQELKKTQEHLSNLRTVMESRLEAEDSASLESAVKRTAAFVQEDIKAITNKIAEFEQLAAQAAHGVSEHTVESGETPASVPPFILAPEMRVKAETVPTAEVLPTESFEGPVVTTFGQTGDSFSLDQAGGGDVGIKVDFPMPATPESATVEQAVSAAAFELKNLLAIPYLSASERATGEAMFRNVMALQSEGKSSEVLGKVVLSLHDYVESLAHPTDPALLVARAENVIRDMNHTDVPGRNTMTIRSLAEGVVRIAAEETAAGTDGSRTARAYETLMTMIREDAKESTVIPENVPSAGAYETPEVVRTRETPKPLEVRFETLRDARVAYRDALLRAITFKKSADQVQGSTTPEAFTEYASATKADVEAACSLYHTVFEDVSREYNRPLAENTEINALEDTLQNEKSKIAALAKKFAKWAVPVTAGFFAVAELTTDNTKTFETAAAEGGLFTQADIPTAPAKLPSLGSSIESVPSVTADAPVEIVEGVVLAEPQVSDEMPQVDLAKSQPPAVSGITFAYPSPEIPAPILNTTETLRVPVISAETPVSPVSIPPGWGENNPGVEFLSPESIPGNAMYLGERDISPSFDLEPMASMHTFTHGEGLWDVVMGTTEVSDLPSLKGESYEFRRDIWKHLHDKAIHDASFRESLGDVRIADNGQPWIFGALNLETINNFVNAEKSAANKPEKVSERVIETLAPRAPQVEVSSAVPVVTEQVTATAAEQPHLTLTDAWNFVERFPGGGTALEDEVSRFVQKVEGMYAVPKRGFSLLHMFDHQYVDPYEALAPVTLRDIRAVMQMKDMQAMNQKLREWNITREGFAAWAKYLKEMMIPGHPLNEVSDTLTLEEVTPLLFAAERLSQPVRV